MKEPLLVVAQTFNTPKADVQTIIDEMVEQKDRYGTMSLVLAEKAGAERRGIRLPCMRWQRHEAHAAGRVMKCSSRESCAALAFVRCYRIPWYPTGPFVSCESTCVTEFSQTSAGEPGAMRE